LRAAWTAPSATGELEAEFMRYSFTAPVIADT